MVGAIEDGVSASHVCSSVAKSLPIAPLHPRKWPAKPWERANIDFFEKDELNFLTVVDVTPHGSK